MQRLRERILTEGRIQGSMLSVSSFLNRVVDPLLMKEMGEAFYTYFRDLQPTKILTVESSGIAPALMTAYAFSVPLVIAKKSSTNVDGDHLLHTSVYSSTHQKNYEVILEASSLVPGDRILLIDDFLSRGHAVLGMADLIEQAGAQLLGVGIVIEKAYEPGRLAVERSGVPLYSLAKVTSLEGGVIHLAEEGMEA